MASLDKATGKQSQNDLKSVGETRSGGRKKTRIPELET
jgi:hypothetical protein